MIAGGSMGTRSWAWAVTAAAGELRERLALGGEHPAGGDHRAVGHRRGRSARCGEQERHSFGAQFAEVAVDAATGEVRVRRMLGIFAAGRIVNPLTARSQLIGGMIWGLSMALHEEAVRDQASGGHVNADLAGYHVAANADVPLIEADWVDDPDTGRPRRDQGHRRGRDRRSRGGDRQRGLARDRRAPPEPADPARPGAAGGNRRGSADALIRRRCAGAPLRSEGVQSRFQVRGCSGPLPGT